MATHGDWVRQRQSEAEQAASAKNYHLYHQASAAALHDIRGQNVLVVGCNRGEDCEYFASLGAVVIGIDVIADIGRKFQHLSTMYVKATAERMPLAAEQFRLVFSHATMEHVPDICAAFAEMVRVCAPGGFIYSLASPLWCSRSGPHWGNAFTDWEHLRISADKIVALGRNRIAAGSSSFDHTEAQIRYLCAEPNREFNKRRAAEYLDSCSRLRGVKIIHNAIDMEQQSGYDPDVVGELLGLGYTTVDLFGLTHQLIAQKLS